eukprot:445458-Pelagomonas_calceolata.AAC.1
MLETPHACQIAVALAPILYFQGYVWILNPAVIMGCSHAGHTLCLPTCCCTCSHLVLAGLCADLEPCCHNGVLESCWRHLTLARLLLLLLPPCTFRAMYGS